LDLFGSSKSVGINICDANMDVIKACAKETIKQDDSGLIDVLSAGVGYNISGANSSG
jgi:hypothetical protein